MPMLKQFSVVSLAALTLLLSACGGSGGGPVNSNSSFSSSSVSSVSSSSISSASSTSSSVSSISSSLSSSSLASSSVINLYSLADFPMGVAVSAGNENRSLFDIQAKQDIVKQHFSQLTAGNIMKMSYLHPAQNTYTFDNADALVNWADANGIAMHAHALIWHSGYQVPGWMSGFSGTQSEWVAMMNEHVQTIAAHFAGRVDSWDVVNEAFENTSAGYRNTVFYNEIGAEYLENAFVAARAGDSQVDLYYNDYSIEAEPVKLGHVLAMVDDFQSRNIPIDGIGFQMHVFLDYPSISAISAAFQQVVDRGLKVKITELDVVLNNPYNSSAAVYTSLTTAAAELQKQRYYNIVKAYKNIVPENLRGGITVWGIWDGDSWLNPGSVSNIQEWPLLFGGPANGPYIAKPAFNGVVDALTE